MPNINRTPSSSSSPLVLNTLGGASVTYVDVQEGFSTLLGPGKPLALLVYVISAAARSVPRDQLIELLWPDFEPEAGRHALRQTVWSIRQKIGDDVVSTDGGQLTISERLRSDRDDFVDAVQNVELERALDVYGGDFLDGFGSTVSAEFEQWVDAERYRLQLILRRTSEVAIRRRLSRGRFREALDLARRVRRLDPEHVGTWCLLIEALMSAGDHVAAEIEADALEEFHASDDRPMEADTKMTLTLARQMSADSEREETPRLNPELIGRERQFTAIISAWRETREGHARHVHVTGDPGIGKTRLAAAVHQRLKAAGSTVVYMRANPGEQEIPFAMAGDLAGSVGALPGAMGISPGAAGTLVTLHPRLTAHFNAAPDNAVGDEAHRRRTLALAELLSAVSDEAPLAVIIDDVHWCDDVSRRLLQGLLGKLTEQRVFVLTTGRVGITGALRMQDTVDLSIQELDVVQVTDLLESIAALPSEPWAESLPRLMHEATGGSPLLVIETLQLAIDKGTMTLGEIWDCADGEALDSDLSRGGALRHRLSRLEPQQIWLATLLSVAGRPVPTPQLLEASGQAATGLADLGVLERRGLVTRSGAGWTASHDETAAVTIEVSGDEMTRAANASLGAVLARHGDNDVNSLLLAGKYLTAGGDLATTRATYRRWAGLMRARGDARPASELAREFMGPAASQFEVASLASEVPEAIPAAGVASGPRVAVAVTLLLTGAALGFTAAHLIGVPSREPSPTGGQQVDTVFAAAETDSAGTVSRFAGSPLIPTGTVDGGDPKAGQSIEAGELTPVVNLVTKKNE